MKRTASTIARTMMGISRTMPTAVMTESREKMASRATIWAITLPKLAAAPWVEACPVSPSSFWWISWVAFAMRNRPPRIRIRSRPENSSPSTLKSGAVSRITQARERRSAIRMNIARASPMRRARLRSPGGSFPARIEMKTMLSMPSTSSRAVSVASAIQACGSKIQSMGSSSQVRFGSALVELFEGGEEGVGDGALALDQGLDRTHARLERAGRLDAARVAQQEGHPPVHLVRDAARLGVALGPVAQLAQA